MAYKRKKKYTSEEKFRYHSGREYSPGKYGLKYGGAAHCYSVGFSDGFHLIDNTSAIKGEFGKRSSNSYAIGNKRGRAASLEYFKRTGKQPHELKR